MLKCIYCGCQVGSSAIQSTCGVCEDRIIRGEKLNPKYKNEGYASVIISGYEGRNRVV